jgi:hypothetical protein
MRRGREICILLFGCLVLAPQASIVGNARADDASDAWRQVLSKCAKTDVIGKQSLFFGISNSVGPGSVWRFADDKSIRLMFELSDAFSASVDQARLVSRSNVANCTGDSSFGWNVKLGLPFSTAAIPISIDISTVLGSADKVTVSVAGFAVDVLKETPWKQAFRLLGPDNPYFQELSQPNRVIAENVVKVTGLKATFVFGTKLSAGIQAMFKGKIFSLGAASTKAEPSGGGAGLHADVTDDNTITITADGPFYLLAAYSKLVGGIPLGLDIATAPIVLAPANIPEGIVVQSDRKRM